MAISVTVYALLLVLTMAAYGVYRCIKPNAPKYNKIFIIVPIALGIVWIVCLDILRHAFKSGNTSIGGDIENLLILSLIAYAVLYFTRFVPEGRRKWVALSASAILIVFIVQGCVHLYNSTLWWGGCPPLSAVPLDYRHEEDAIWNLISRDMRKLDNCHY